MKWNFDTLDKYRIRSGVFASLSGEDFGAFIVPGPHGRDLKIIANSADPSSDYWEHVSVSLSNRTPNWDEMCFVKELFWDAEEIVIQLHPPRSQWINNHPHCLHLWRNPHQAIPLPPAILVGVSNVGVLVTEGGAQ